MKFSNLRRAAGVSVLVVGVLAGTGSAFALSADAQMVVDGVTAAGGATAPACSDVQKLTEVVTQVTTKLATEGKLTGDAKAAGEEAGKAIYENCK
ncbi:MAG: hypothetical protein J0H54_12810 [Rhizobiales bacterium]|nr:hypothetical protein [Hyphomicrobiales bacterium]